MRSVKHPVISGLLVFIQFGTLALLLYYNPWFVSNLGLLLQIAAIILGVAALTSMHLSHLSLFPDPLPNIRLVTHGPYRWIRHPMYASLLLFFMPITFTALDPVTTALYGVLTLNLLVKLHYEEHLLQTHLTDYPAYQQHTKKLIPYLY